MIRNKRLTETEEEYRVISVDIHTDGIHLWGTYTNLQDALDRAKEVKQDSLEVYVHGDSNRVVSKVE
jgi:hypothetical protein